MTDRVIRIAASVIARSSREQAADAVLRGTLKGEQRRLLPGEARAISLAVFAYYRWQGWLNPGDPVERQLMQAGEFAKEFRDDPASFGSDELNRAVPAWIHDAQIVTPEWLRSLQAEPRLWLRAKKGQGRELAKKLGSCRIPTEPALADALEYQGTEDLFRSRELHAGEFEIQDVTSQIVGCLCDPKPGSTWWDACAGKGGKTLHLSDLMNNKGLIWASDRAEWRLKRLKIRAARAQCFNYRSAFWDGGPVLPTKTKFDGAVLDAPCSGIGTWARNPHARWTTTPEDVRELSDVQAKLLAEIAPTLKPGGKLIYAVCTLARAETTEVAHAFTKAFPDLEPVPLTLPGGKLGTRSLDAAPTLTIWPQDMGGNGMFIAAWRRREAPPAPAVS